MSREMAMALSANGYVLNLMPPTDAVEAMRAWEHAGDGHVTNVARVMHAVERGEALGTWSAPVDGLAGELCFLRVGRTSARRFSRVAEAMRLLVVPGDGLIDALAAESSLLRESAGKVVAVARTVTDSTVAGGPRTAWAWLGRPVGVRDAEGSVGVPVSDIAPHGRRISTFGGITRLDPDEVQALLQECGLAASDVVGI